MSYSGLSWEQVILETLLWSNGNPLEIFRMKQLLTLPLCSGI